jgi:hypothetical protein
VSDSESGREVAWLPVAIAPGTDLNTLVFAETDVV